MQLLIPIYRYDSSEDKMLTSEDIFVKNVQLDFVSTPIVKYYFNIWTIKNYGIDKFYIQLWILITYYNTYF